MELKGIILAAGRGSRMGNLTDDLPKCRTKFKGKELIQWQLESLKQAGIDDISIVTGYLAETFEFKLNYFNNKIWKLSNMVRSLLSAKTWLENYDCVISYSDIIYSKSAVKKLIEKQGDIVISYDPNWKTLWKKRFVNPLSDAETFKIDNKGILTEIGKKTKTFNDIEGQYMGLFKISPRGWLKIKTHIENLDENEINLMDMTTLLNFLINKNISIYTSAIDDKWYEFDTESDLIIYESLES